MRRSYLFQPAWLMRCLITWIKCPNPLEPSFRVLATRSKELGPGLRIQLLADDAAVRLTHLEAERDSTALQPTIVDHDVCFWGGRSDVDCMTWVTFPFIARTLLVLDVICLLASCARPVAGLRAQLGLGGARDTATQQDKWLADTSNRLQVFAYSTDHTRLAKQKESIFWSQNIYNQFNYTVLGAHGGSFTRWQSKVKLLMEPLR